jgi:hypothetical protein
MIGSVPILELLFFPPSTVLFIRKAVADDQIPRTIPLIKLVPTRRTPGFHFGNQQSAPA